MHEVFDGVLGVVGLSAALRRRSEHLKANGRTRGPDGRGSVAEQSTSRGRPARELQEVHVVSADASADRHAPSAPPKPAADLLVSTITEEESTLAPSPHVEAPASTMVRVQR